MTKAELLVKLKEINTGDPDVDHHRADELLLEFINDGEISEAYEAIEKWYA